MSETRHDVGERVKLRLMLREQTRDIRPRDAALVIVVVWLLAVVAWGVAEHFIDDETFPTIWLGMWWALETVTTVGYGDVVPAQAAGRLLATLLLLGGLAFITVVTASITTGFVALRERQRQEAGEDPVLQRLDAIARRLDGVERDLAVLREPGADGAGSPEGRPGDA